MQSKAKFRTEHFDTFRTPLSHYITIILGMVFYLAFASNERNGKDELLVLVTTFNDWASPPIELKPIVFHLCKNRPDLIYNAENIANNGVTSDCPQIWPTNLSGTLT